ncbi:MAG: hypothetical protein JWO56_3703 [Acidobacteria bacterium]|nr:hypothetical protein [Acidobacteriota bacterium]
MKTSRIPILIAIVALVATTIFGQPMPTPKAPSKLPELQYFAGNWDSTGTGFASPGMPEHPTKGKAVGGWTLSNQWLAISYDEMKTPANAHPVMARLFLGYDPEQNKLVSGAVDNMGGYSTGTSDGWMGSVLTFDGPLHSGGMTAKSRETFTKKSAKELVHSSSMEMNGKWQKLDEETCWKK